MCGLWLSTVESRAKMTERNSERRAYVKREADEWTKASFKSFIRRSFLNTINDIKKHFNFTFPDRSCFMISAQILILFMYCNLGGTHQCSLYIISTVLESWNVAIGVSGIENMNIFPTDISTFTICVGAWCSSSQSTHKRFSNRRK